MKIDNIPREIERLRMLMAQYRVCADRATTPEGRQQDLDAEARCEARVTELQHRLSKEARHE